MTQQLAPGTVALVGAGPGDPGLLTLRGAQLLGQADVVLVDRLVDPGVLEHVRADAEVVDVGKTSWTGTAPRQEEINAQLVSHARAGRRVVRLKGGDPFVFGRGSEEAAALVAAGVPFLVVPGVTSAIAAAAYAGIPVTARGYTQDVCIVTGHLDPDDEASQVRWQALATGPGTLVILMGHDRLPLLTQGLIRYGRAPDTPAACVQQGTTANQRVIVSTLERLAADVAEAGLQAPVATIVGDVVTLRETLQWFTP
ncbi:MAG: uroporphyrin-III C-methyltransferase [Frankiales bacterium]|jgi:uroporphyrin-III C-methyltransferase|nr:uroporphyrin-III C-methyltransferase [Frankiales bacterium]